MTVHAKPVQFLAVPFAGPFAVDPRFPVPEYGAMALAAEVVGFFKGDEVTICQPQFVPVIRVVAVKAPSLFAGMVEHLGNFHMFIFQLPSFGVDFHVSMAVGAGEYPFRERWWRDKELGNVIAKRNLGSSQKQDSRSKIEMY